MDEQAKYLDAMFIQALKIIFLWQMVFVLACSGGASDSENKPDTPNCSGSSCDPTTPRVLQGAVIYVTPRNNEIIADGDYNYTYDIEFLVDRTSTLADIQHDLSITLPALAGGTQAAANITVTQGTSYNNTYYTASFPYTGNQATPQALMSGSYMKEIKVCANNACSGVSQVDVVDVKRSVGFEAISRAGFGYGLYVSLLMPDYELQPINASTFFSSKDPGIYEKLTPLWDWSEVDWEFVPMNSTLAGRNEFMYCTQVGNAPCDLYWTNMRETKTTVPVKAPASPQTGYTLNYVLKNSGAQYSEGPNAGQPIPSFDALESYMLSNQTQFSNFDNTPHGVAINSELMGGITGFQGSENWGKVSDPNFSTNYPTAYALRQRFLTLNIIHMPYGHAPSTANPVPTGTRSDIDVTKIPSSESFLGTNYVGHGLIGTEIYQELKGGPPRTAVGANYSSPTGVLGTNAYQPYRKFYYYAVNYTALTMDFYIVDPADPKLAGGELNLNNILQFTPVRQFPIRNDSADTISTIDPSTHNLVDHDYYGLMKFGLDEPSSEGCNVSVYSYGALNGFCALKWQIQTWLIAGLAGSEYASQSLLANNYLKSIAVYPAPGQPQSAQKIDFTQLNDKPGDSKYWLYQFQKDFAITYAMGPYLGDSVGYLVKGFWNLDLGKNPTDSASTLIFKQMPYTQYAQLSTQQEKQGNYVYVLTANVPKTEVVLDLLNYAHAAVDSYDRAESELVSVPVGKTAQVTVFSIDDLSNVLKRGTVVAQTCNVTFNSDGTLNNSCPNPQFALTLVKNHQINLNAPSAVEAAKMTGCSNGRCTYTVSWTNPTAQYPAASFFVVPNQSWVSVPGVYYADLVQGGAIVPASQNSATFTMDQKYAGPSNPNVTVFACSGGSCPNAANQYSIADIPGTSSSNGLDLKPVTGVAQPTVSVSEQRISTTWTNPNSQDADAYCYLNVSNIVNPPQLNHATSYLQRCSGQQGNIVFDNSVTIPSSAVITVVACVQNSFINTCPTIENSYTPVSSAQVNSNSAGLTVRPVSNPSAAMIKSCDAARCTYEVSWTNSAEQLGGTQYFIVPQPVWAPPEAYYADLLTGSALVTYNGSTSQTATFTLNKALFVGPSNPDVTIYACKDSTCPSAPKYSVGGLPGVSSSDFSSHGSNLLPVIPVATSNDWASNSLTVKWELPPSGHTDLNAYCFVVPNGSVLSNVTNSNFVVPCANLTGTITLSTLPPTDIPKTFYVSSCIQNTYVNTCPTSTNRYKTDNLAIVNSGTAKYGP